MQRTPAENRALIDDLKKKREAFIDDAMERRAWTDEKRARNAIGQLRVDGVPIIIDAAKSRQLDEAGNIALSPAHREELQRILRFYTILHQTHEGWRADKTINQQLKAFDQTLENLITFLGKVNFQDVKLAEEGLGGKLSIRMQIIFQRTRTPPASFMDTLLALREETNMWSRNRKGGVPLHTPS